MRLRNVTEAYEKVGKHHKVIKKPEIYKGRWREFFQNNHPIYIEIGMGKGQFIIEQAKRNKNVNYIGFEKFTSVLSRALKKIDREQEELDNLAVVRMDVEHLLDIFDEDEIDRIYLNFSDPWPKERHAKRRLTYVEFLKKYNVVLKQNSSIIFKTDNEDLFDFSYEQIQLVGMTIIEYTRDLHSSKFRDHNIETEYERKFVDMGKNIFMFNARVH